MGLHGVVAVISAVLAWWIASRAASGGIPTGNATQGLVDSGRPTIHSGALSHGQRRLSGVADQLARAVDKQWRREEDDREMAGVEQVDGPTQVSLVRRSG